MDLDASTTTPTAVCRASVRTPSCRIDTAAAVASVITPRPSEKHQRAKFDNTMMVQLTGLNGGADFLAVLVLEHVDSRARQIAQQRQARALQCIVHTHCGVKQKETNACELHNNALMQLRSQTAVTVFLPTSLAASVRGPLLVRSAWPTEVSPTASPGVASVLRHMWASARRADRVAARWWRQPPLRRSAALWKLSNGHANQAVCTFRQGITVHSSAADCSGFQHPLL